MKLFKRKPGLTAEEYIADICSTGKPNAEDLDVLVNIVRLLRPSRPNRLTVMDISSLLFFLRANEEYAYILSDYIKQVLHRKKFNQFLSDAAILQDVDFFFELRKRFYAKILPNQPQKDRLEYVLNQVFYLASDCDWISKIPQEQLEELFDALHFDTIYETTEPDSPLSEMLLAMNLIIQRVSGRAMETEVIKMVPEFDGLESPFSAFELELIQIEERIRNSDLHFIMEEDLSYRQLEVLHIQCEQFVERAFSNSVKYGISMRVNQNLLKIRQQLERIKILMPFLTIKTEEDKKKNTIQLALELINYNCYKNNVRKFFAESTQLISYEITQHTARTGEHYITQSRTEYFRMLWSALGGGFIVGLMCIIKLLLSYTDSSYFGYAFYYSMNYALGFIIIYLLGFTVATKQPAMTASALVRALEQKNRESGKVSERYSAFAVLFARVFRSQFIAFVGNVSMAFPVALGGAWLIERYLEVNVVEPKWLHMMTDLSPIHSAAILHAAIAGIFLFLSGIISGSIANRDKHGQVYFRIEEHPILKRSFGIAGTKKIAAIYEKKWAGIISNFWFGVMMGSTGIIGLFLGLNIDIRHISFASGNLGMSLYGAHYAVSSIMLFWAIVGVGVIGFVNFSVSFGLSLGLAFRSRNIPLSELQFVLGSIWQHFKKKPGSFFFPSEKKQAQAPQVIPADINSHGSGSDNP
jgi:site-specific recombinase